MKYLSALAGALLAACPLYARHVPQVCGTHRLTQQQELFLHRQAQARTRKMAPRAASPTAADVGDIAIVTDADGVVIPRNPFTLQSKTVRFTPSRPQAAGYKFATSDGGYDDAAAKAGSPITGFGDDDTRGFNLPFSFPFYGTSYSNLWVNSNGNLTFTTGDKSPDVAMSLGLIVAGPPRIVVFGDDLDPTAARSTDGVFVTSEAGRFVVTWVSVPEWVDAGIGPLVTAQARLYPDGRIEFSYLGVAASSGVVGISPGGLRGNTNLVSFLSGSSDEFTGAVAETYSGTALVDIYRATQRFYESHEDAYDYLVIYNGLNLATSDGSAIAITTVARNTNISGTGDVPADVGREFGSARRLQAVLNMGATGQYPQDPNAHVSLRGPTADTPLTILGHEAGHLFLAYASVRDPGNPDARPMLGRDLFHWSFNFNSEASFLEGNRIRDNGAGTAPRFETVDNSRQYSPLDQYLMGLRLPEEVPPMFLVQGTGIANDRFPQAGVALSGTRRDILIDEVIGVVGRRIPDANVAQRHYRFGFILIQSAAGDPNPAQIARIDAYRQGFAALYAAATGNRATADVSLKRALSLSLYPAGGVLEGGTGMATLSIEKVLSVPLTIALKSQSGLLSVSNTVTLPAGSRSVSFSLRGMARGIDEITAEPGDTTFETAFARVPVSAAAAVRITATVNAGQQGKQDVNVLVRDDNRVPYSGVPIQVAVSGGGTVAPVAPVTGVDGAVALQWTPGSGASNQLTLSISGGPSVVVGLAGAPVISTAGFVNSASYGPQLSPNTIASLFASNLGGDIAALQILINGESAPIFFTNGTLANFLIPATQVPGPVSVVVSSPSGTSNTVTLQLAEVSPGIFYNPNTGLGALQVAGSGQLTDVRPAAVGDYVEVYATGLGMTQKSTRYPGLLETRNEVTAAVNGHTAPVLYSGPVAGYPGLYLVNIQVPPGAGSGMQPVQLTVLGQSSNSVSIRLQ